MKFFKRKTLQQKILLSVSIVTLVLAIVAAFASFFNEFNRARLKTASMITQLLDTVENNAAIAVYAKDNQIAQDVISGLLKNDIVNSVQITSEQGFNLKHTKNQNNIEVETRRELYAPFGDSRIIGQITIQPSAQYNLTEASHSALINATSSFILILVTALNILWIIRVNFSEPVTFVSNTLHAIKEGKKQRIPKLTKNKGDELGRLVEDINNLLQALEDKFNEERFLREKVESIEHQLRLIFDSTSAGLFLLDEQGRLLTSNVTLKMILKIPDNGEHALTYHYTIAEFFIEQLAFEQLLTQALLSGQLESRDFSLKVADNEKPVWLHCLVSKVVNPHGEVRVEGVLFDVTERVENEIAIKYEVDHDALTGLLRYHAAKSGFEKYLMSRNSSNVSIFLMDLDGFKQVNDVYGHHAGDKVLMIAAQRLTHCVRATDLVCRMGGDEFLIVLINCGPPYSIAESAETIVKAIQMPMRLDEKITVRVGISLGIANLSDEEQNFERLTKAADAAMYEVKRQGKNGFCIYSDTEMSVKRFHPEKDQLP